MKKYLLIFVVCALFLFGCSDSSDKINNDGTVSYMYAKELIINNNAKLVDVRTSDEYKDNHIEGALLLTLDDIDADRAKEVIGDTNTYVIVYCKSGVRSSEAKRKLTDLGYTNVYDLGSIDNWKE